MISFLMDASMIEQLVGVMVVYDLIEGNTRFNHGFKG